ncbi:MAG TPA: HD domain-containing protein, partial [Candidatus Limnocylindria bacterium]|nr:HD domain-containing protein [Candidatus Limnocylindria bacterium]
PPPGPQWYRVSFGSHRASDLPVLTKEHVLATFPAIGTIADARLRSLSVDVWRYVSDRNPAWSDIERVPLHPTMPIATHGNLVKHIVGMVRLFETLVPLYAELWQQRMDIDAYRAAAYVHDAAKVIEFRERGGALEATPGYNHAIEAGRIVRELGGPEHVAHMVEAHSFAGPLVVPRTKEAQLFLLGDPMCLNVFPEHGASAIERHLKANGWEDPKTLERYRPPT